MTAAALCGREGNRRSGVTHQAPCVTDVVAYPATQWLRQDDENGK